MARYGNPVDDNYAYGDDDLDTEFLKNLKGTLRDQKFEELEQRAIKSSEASINILRETEEIGIRTAEELVAQREQLERSEKRLDNINATLRFSQRHIQGIKSIFGSLKNYLSGQPTDPSQSKTSDPSTSTSSSTGAESPSRDQQKNSFGSNEFRPSNSGYRLDKSFDEEVEKPQPSSRFMQTNKILDENIDEISSSLTRLKGLSLGLSEEIDTQNSLLERMNEKSDKAEVQISRQDREIKRLLK